MSRIGKLPVAIPEKIEVKLEKNFLVCKGPKGELNRQLHPEMDVKIEDNQIIVKRPSDSKEHRSLHGLTRSLINNMVLGVSAGFTKRMLIEGVGYKAEMKGKKLLLTLGFSHPILMSFPDTVTVRSVAFVRTSGVPDKIAAGAVKSPVVNVLINSPANGLLKVSCA